LPGWAWFTRLTCGKPQNLAMRRGLIADKLGISGEVVEGPRFVFTTQLDRKIRHLREPAFLA
jgi:hypothetical protein